MIQTRHHRSRRNPQHGKVGSQLLEQHHEFGRVITAFITVSSYVLHVRRQSSAMSEMALGIRLHRSQLERDAHCWRFNVQHSHPTLAKWPICMNGGMNPQRNGFLVIWCLEKVAPPSNLQAREGSKIIQELDGILQCTKQSLLYFVAQRQALTGRICHAERATKHNLLSGHKTNYSSRK